MTTYKNCNLKKSKSRSGEWCTVIYFPNGDTQLANNFKNARWIIDTAKNRKFIANN